MGIENLQELFPCNVPLCPKILRSKADFESHILAEHGEKTTWNFDIDSTDFDFEPATDELDKSGSTLSPIKCEKGKSKRKQPEDEKNEARLTRISCSASAKIDTKIPSSVLVTQALKSEENSPEIPDDNIKPLAPIIKTETYDELSPKNLKRKYTKRPKSDVVKVAKNPLPRSLVKSKSDFSIDRIESLIKISLSLEAKQKFETLIEEGKDQEIYCNIFGNIFMTAEFPLGLKCRNWICKFCPNGKFLGSREEFEAHFEAFGHGKLLYTCELCNKTQKSFETLKSHLRFKHFTDAKCDTCEEVFPTVGKMLTHKLNVHKIGGYQCDMCTKMCPSMQRLKIHVQENHSGQTFSCSTCMRVFKTKGSCVAHEATHSGKVYECEFCIDTFVSEIGKAKHEKFQHSQDFQKHACDECGKVFNQKTSLNTHKKYHQRHPDLVCEVCNKLFHKRYAKALHKKVVHEHERRFACERCEFRTVSNGKLDHHIKKTHENQQEICFLCNIVVKHPYQHVRSAHSDKPTAWKEFMERKKAAMRMLKIRTKEEVIEPEEQELLPSDHDIYPEQ